MTGLVSNGANRSTCRTGVWSRLCYKGEVLHALTSKVVSTCQSLDMQNAIHERETTFETTDGTQSAFARDGLPAWLAAT